MEILGGGILLALTIGIVEAIKRTGKIKSQYVPITAILVGILISGLINLDNLQWSVIITGIVAGLSSCGLWDLGSKTIETFKK